MKVRIEHACLEPRLAWVSLQPGLEASDPELEPVLQLMQAATLDQINLLQCM